MKPDYIVALEQAGYRRYPVPQEQFVVGAWQKPFLTGDQKAFFINVTLYDFPKAGIMASAKAQLYRKGLTFEVSLTFEDIKVMEDLFAEVFSNLNCLPDIHNN